MKQKWEKNVLPHNVCAGAINVDINPNESQRQGDSSKNLGKS
jgi:hypothetical protein